MNLNSKIINTLMFAAGAAIGSVVTWKVLKTRYEKITKEEIESVKETFAEYFVNKDNISEEETSEDDDERPANFTHQINWGDYEDLDEEDAAEEAEYQADEADRFFRELDAMDEEYSQLTSRYTNEEGGSDSVSNIAREPYVISPDEFASLDDWKQMSLTYYDDDILEDESYNIIKNRDELIGRKALTTFGEYEDDSVFVRNERLRTDFEILKDYRTYDQARHAGPSRVDDE